MSFERVAERMKARHKPSRADRLQQLWTGEPPELPPLPEPVAPARRTSVLLAAYALLVAGFLIALAGGVTVVLWFDKVSRWELRGLVFVIGIGGSLVVKSMRLFERASATAPLPEARTSTR